ncbi:MAG: hypothetical protein ACJ75H_12330 [Thermoanaerobaculia bacterium]
MPQPTRRVLAAASLMAALLLAVPAPSRAAGFTALPDAAAVAGRIGAWLESLLVGAPAARLVRPAHRGMKATTAPTTSTTEPSPTTQQGNMVDPNGIR